MTAQFNYALPCTNGRCPRRIDNKCSIWNRPTKAVCQDYVNAFTNMSGVAAAFTGACSGALGEAVRQASQFQKDLARMGSLSTQPTPWPVGGMVPVQGHAYCGNPVHAGIDYASHELAVAASLNHRQVEARPAFVTPLTSEASEQLYKTTRDVQRRTLHGEWRIPNVKDKLTLKEALDLSILLWDDLAESGAISKVRSKYYTKIAGLKAQCPMCEYYRTEDNDVGCSACPLVSCTDSPKGLYSSWCNTPTTKERKQTANALSQRLKDFRAEKFPQVRESIESLEEALSILLSRKEYCIDRVAEKQEELEALGVRHKNIEIDIQKVKAKIQAEKDAKQKRLFLIVALGGLNIVYSAKDSSLCKMVSLINSNGEFEALSNTDSLETYNQWIKDGGRIDENIVEWRNRSYYIDSASVLRSFGDADERPQRIYDFKAALPCCNCTDPNIITTEHNNRVVIF